MRQKVTIRSSTISGYIHSWIRWSHVPATLVVVIVVVVVVVVVIIVMALLVLVLTIVMVIIIVNLPSPLVCIRK